MYARHCDTEGCDTWQRIDTTNPVFVTVYCPGHLEFHFCSLDHVMKWAAANSVPTEVMSTEGE
jgi:hypothetical protein